MIRCYLGATILNPNSQSIKREKIDERIFTKVVYISVSLKKFQA